MEFITGGERTLAAPELQRTASMDAIDVDVKANEKGVESSLDDQPEKALYLNDLSDALLQRFERRGDVNDLEAAIQNSKRAVRLSASLRVNNSERAIYLDTHGTALGERFRISGSLDDLHAQVKAFEEILTLLPDDHLERAMYLDMLGCALNMRMKNTSFLSDLDPMVKAHEKAVELTPLDDAERVWRLQNLSFALQTRFTFEESMTCLNAAAEASEEAVQLIEASNPDRPIVLYNFFLVLLTRSRYTDSMDDLNRAIRVVEELVKLVSQDHPNRALYLTQLGIALEIRFQKAALLDDLDTMIEVFREVTELPHSDDPERHVFVNNLGVALRTRYEQTESLDDLSAAVRVSKEAVDLVRKHRQDGTPSESFVPFLGAERSMEAASAEHQDLIMVLTNQSIALIGQLEQNESVENLDAVIKILEELLQLGSKDDPQRGDCLKIVSGALHKRFDLLGSVEDLRGAILMGKEEMRLAPKDVDRSLSLNNASVALVKLFELTGSPDSLNEAVEAGEMAMELIMKDGSDQELYRSVLGNLGNAIMRRYDRFGTTHDLRKGVQLYEEAFKWTFENDQERAIFLNGLCFALRMRFEQNGTDGDIRRAIEAGKMAVQSSSEPMYLSNLGCAYLAQYERSGSVEDLNMAVEMSERVKLMSEGHSQRRVLLNFRALALLRLFSRTRAIHDGNAAVEANKELIESLPEDHPSCALHFSNLSHALLGRFERSESITDLTTAVEAAEKAVKLTPTDNPSLCICLDALGMACLARYELTGSMDDLIRSVDARKHAAKLIPDNHVNQSLYFNNLSVSLRVLFQCTGSTDDLDKALKFNMTAAAKYSSKGDPNQMLTLCNLALILVDRFKRNGLRDDIDIAVELSEKAVNLSLGDPFRQAAFSACLSLTLFTRYNQYQLADDLNVAVEMGRAAVDLLSEDHQNRPIYLQNLASLLRERFKLTRSMDDLNGAVDAGQKAVDLSPGDDLRKVTYLTTSGSCLKTRFLETQQISDSVGAVDAYEKAFESDIGLPTERVTCAIQCATLLRDHNIGKASKMLARAVELLPKATPRSLIREEQQYELSSFTGLGSHAAALSVRAGSDNVLEAVRLLELGRGVMASVYFEARSDITALEKAQPALAEEFKRLRQELERANDYTDATLHMPETQRTLRSQTARRYKAARELDDLLKTIRKADGFHHFLLGPSGDELTSIAKNGPVVILNASTFGSDAFLITHQDGIRRLPLEKLSYNDLQDRADELRQLIKEDNQAKRRDSNKALRSILDSLWNDVVEPSLSVLGFDKPPEKDEPWPHVWWIPTGLLSLFPIHATGYRSIGGRQTLDRVISSYAPTIRALSHARDQIQNLHTSSSTAMMPNNKQHILLASMRKTPNRTDLPYAAAEVAAVSVVLATTAEVKALVLQDPTAEEVLNAIQRCSVVHFACHGETSPDPSQSKILFSDWETTPFSVAYLSDLKLSQVQLAFLSACHAAGNEDLSLLDEAIHMAGACQLAGFPVVIGTLWQVMDRFSENLAVRVYRTMMPSCNSGASGVPGKLDVRKAALGLHLAIREMRDETNKIGKKIGNPMAWAPYIHVGA